MVISYSCFHFGSKYYRPAASDGYCHNSVNSPAAGAGDNLVVISGLDPPPAAEDLLGFSFVVNKWVIKHVC